MSSTNIDNYEIFHRAIGFIRQAYSFFFSCLPHEDQEFPNKTNKIYFESLNHVKGYENELSYSFLLRIFNVFEELCNRLELGDREIPIIIKNSSNLSDETKDNYTHIRKLRHVIAHGNGDGEIIRNRYASYTKDRNGYLCVHVTELEGMISTITLVAKEINNYAE